MNKLGFVFIILFISTFLSAGTINYSKNFEYPQIRENDKYINIDYGDIIARGEEGSPGLPWSGVDLLLPPGEQLKRVTVLTKEYYSEIKTGVIKPIGKFFPISEPISADYQAQPDSAIYSKDAIFPENCLGAFSTGFLCGHSLGNLSICPVEYNTVQTTIRFISSISLELETEPVERAGALSLNFRGGEKIAKRLEQIVENPEAINSYRDLERPSNIDLLLITSSELADTFQEYVNYKNRTGYATILEVTESIYASYPGIDEAEKVRNCIIDYYQNYGIDSVILGGDTGNPFEAAVVPHRGFSVFDDRSLPSDIYFSNLDGSWNDDGDEEWGEYEEMDVYAEVTIGRMCVDSVEEVANMINKHILYQNDPVEEDIEKAALLGEILDEETYGGASKEEIVTGGYCNYMWLTGISENFIIDRFYDGDETFTIEDIFAEFSETGINILNHIGHSNATYNMKMYNSDLTEENFTNNGINRGLAFGYSQGCYNGSFDNWHAYGYYSEDCFAEKMTGGITGGEVTCIANSRYGWYSPGETGGPSQYYDRMFFHGLFGEDLSQIGELNRYSHEADVSLLEFDHLRYIYYTTTLFGDPTLDIWTDLPEVINIILPETVSLGDTGVSIYTNAGSSRIAVFQNNILIGRRYNYGPGNYNVLFETALTSPYPLEITVTAHNRLRFDGEIEVVSELPCVVYQSHTLYDEDGNGNGEPDYGETISLDLELYNGGNQNSLNTIVNVSTEDEYVTIIDGEVTCGIINANSVIELADAVSFEISDAVPDRHEAAFNVTINGEAREEWVSSFRIIMNAPVLALGEVTIDDSESGNNNGILDPGETAEFIVQILNTGGSDSPPAIISLMTNNPFLFIQTQSVELEEIYSGGNAAGNITVQASESIAPGVFAEFILNCQAGNYELEAAFSKSVGLVTENFESGDFSAFDWELTGDANWGIDTLAYAGSYSAVSGEIGNDQISTLTLELDVLLAGDISFMRRLSTQKFEDFLYFYLDGEELLACAGEIQWSPAIYSVEPGHHILEWKYDKNGSEISGSDCVWLDNIMFPPLGIPGPAVIVPNVSELTINTYQGETGRTNLTLSNEGEENLLWTVTKDYYNTRDQGGPDNYGYTWMDSNEGGSVEFDWIDISASGNAVAFTSANEGTALMPLGFTFNFYGSDYEEFLINPNGWIGFGADNTECSNTSLPDMEAPRPAIIPFWDDLYPAIGPYGEGIVYYQNHTDHLVVMFHDVINYPGNNNGTYDFEVIIRENGSIKIQYNTLTGCLDSCTIGIQNAEGTDALQIVYNYDYLEDELAIEFRKVVNWLEVSPANGEIDIYNQQYLSLNASTEELSPGQYVCDLLFHSNDPVQETLIIPVTLNVGEPIFYGDVDGSLVVDEADGLCVLQYVAGLDPLPELDPLPWEIERLEAADVDNNNILESIDGTLILQYAAGIIDIFPAQSGEPADFPDAGISLAGINDNGTNYLQLISEGEIFALTMTAPELEHVNMGEPEIMVNEEAILAWNDMDIWNFSCCSAIAFAENEVIVRIPVELDEEAETVTFAMQINTADWEEYSYDFSSMTENNNEIIYLNELQGNYPNPFNPETTFAFSVSRDKTPVKINIYNIRGQLVKRLVNDRYDTGKHQVTWNAATQASGVYLYRCEIAEYAVINKMLLLK
ncbi:MAG: T9SS type A sorting domain-containing protein [Candidatus Cloacimonetes bacterium]|nr:T9SS type A sorting domain-containing protein [Candidatus Cloacimonadota bacterium]